MNTLNFFGQSEPVTAPIPGLQHIIVEEVAGGSFDVNLVRMVLEHAPARIISIDKDIQTLTERMEKLHIERAAILRLLTAARED
jgi:hypothetical protein